MNSLATLSGFGWRFMGSANIATHLSNPDSCSTMNGVIAWCKYCPSRPMRHVVKNNDTAKQHVNDRIFRQPKP